MLTCPYIAYAVNRICQFMHAPTEDHYVALKRILMYLCGTAEFRVLIKPSDRLSLIGYTDVNWGLEFDDLRFMTGYYVYFGGNPVS